MYSDIINELVLYTCSYGFIKINNRVKNVIIAFARKRYSKF